jgi:hypothetical protein
MISLLPNFVRDANDAVAKIWTGLGWFVPLFRLTGVDVAQISPSLASAGDDSFPATAQHQGGWIMRKPAAAPGKEPRGQETPDNMASARVAVLRNLIQIALDVVVPASEADANRPADAKPRATSALASAASA